MAGVASQPIFVVGGMGKPLLFFRVAGPAQVFPAPQTEACSVDVVAIKTADVFLAVGAEFPFAMGGSVAPAAHVGGNRDRHFGRRVIVGHRSVARFAGDTAVGERGGPFFPPSGVALKTVWFGTMFFPGFLKNRRSERFGMERGSPFLELLGVAFPAGRRPHRFSPRKSRKK